MERDSNCESAFFSPRTLVAFTLCFVGALLGVLSVAANPPNGMTGSAAKPPRNSLFVDQTNAAASASWAIVSSPNSSPTQVNFLQGVSCVSASDCWAVGFYSSDGTNLLTLIEHYDGISWRIVSSPNRTNGDSLYAVTCASSTDCWAVGNDGNAGTLIEHYDGQSWSIVNSPNAMASNYLYGVTCASATRCFAAGQTGDVFAPIRTLVEQYDGNSWSIVSSPNMTSVTMTPQDNYLNAVTCTSASDCWVAGFYYDTSFLTTNDNQTLLNHYDGTSWSIVTSPDSGTVLLPQENYLWGIACVSSSDCTAVGYNYPSRNAQTLVEHYNGAIWSIVTSPNTSMTENNLLYGVACASPSECWAVGDTTSSSNRRQTLIDQYDGNSWSIATSPNTSPNQDNILQAVTCTSATDCWAVGFYFGAAGLEQTLIEHYGVPPAQLVTAVSRMTHGSAGTFDVDLPLTGTPGIECRGRGSSGNYTLVFTFANPLTNVDGASVTSGTGSVSSSNVDPNDAHNYIVNLTRVTNAQVVTVNLSSVTDSAGNFSPAVAAQMGVLIGDVNASGMVDGNDVSAVQSQTRQSVTSTNFRYDVNANGVIDGNDMSITQGQTRTSLP